MRAVLDDVGSRMRSYLPAGVMLVAGLLAASIDQSPASFFYLGAYRVVVGASVAALGGFGIYLLLPATRKRRLRRKRSDESASDGDGELHEFD